MPDDILFEDVLFGDVVQPGATWSHALKRGTALRLNDTEGGANVGALLYNADCPVERLNLPDTLKAQHTARFAQDSVLYSDMGRVLCSLTHDSLGWHNALGGACAAESDMVRYAIEKRYMHACRQSSLLAAGHVKALRGAAVSVGWSNPVAGDCTSYLGLSPVGTQPAIYAANTGCGDPAMAATFSVN